MQLLSLLNKGFLSFLLVAAITSISDNSGTIQTHPFLQSEIVVKNQEDKNRVNYCDVKKYTCHKVILNQFTVFNFKSLLKGSHLNFSITLKSQKKTVFEFLDVNSILKQNLIAYTASQSYNALVK